MTPWEEVRRESLEMPAARRVSPLPWMLLTASILLTLVVIVLGRSRLEDERLRTATALKANDELNGKLKALAQEKADLKDELEQRDTAHAELSRQVVTLELTNQRLEAELRSRGRR